MGQIVTANTDVLEELGIESPTTAETNIVNRAITRAEGAVKSYLGYDPVLRTRTEYYPNREGNSRYDEQGIWDISGNKAILERVSSARTDNLQVRHVPIRSVSDLRIDYDGRSGKATGAFAADTSKTEGVDFWPNYELIDSDGSEVCLDGLIKSFGLWPLEQGTVKIVYRAGYQNAEFNGTSTLLDASPIKMIIIDEAVRLSKSVFVNQSTGIGGGSSSSFAAGTITSERLGDYSYSLGSSGKGSQSDRQFGGLYDLDAKSKQALSEGGFVNWGWKLAGS